MKSSHLTGVLSCLIGDNLALHGIGGFIENFSGGHCCRTCVSIRLEQQACFNESEVVLRGTQSFLDQISEMKQQGFPQSLVKKYGIKTQSSLLEISADFPIERLHPDVAHDLLEGVIPYTVELVLGALIQAKFLTLDVINSRIQSFSFQERNKPQPLKRPKGKGQVKVRGTAKENWVFLRTLPLLVGDFVPEGDKKWGVLIGLCQVVENVIASHFTEGDIRYLEQSISTWLAELKRVFPSFRLKPKFHYLIHYGTHIRRHGPLRYLWTMRYESKHSTPKTFAVRSRSRKDVCKTMAKKHQRALAMHLHDPEFLAPNRTEDPKMSASDMHCLASHELERVDRDTHVGHAITVNGVIYKKDDVILLSGGDVTFGVIRAVLVSAPSHVSLAVTVMDSEFDAHLNAYKVYPSTRSKIISVGDILDYHPLKVYSVHGESWVVLLWYVCPDD